MPRTVSAVWRSEVLRGGTLYVVPDCCVELVRAPDGSVVVWGPSSEPRAATVTQGMAYDGVRLQVGTAPSVLGLPASLIQGRVLPAAELGLASALSAPTAGAWRRRVFALASAGTADWLEDPVASTVPDLLETTGRPIPEVAAVVGLGERQLRRRFAHAVGVSPRTFRRVVRTRRALRDLGPGSAVGDARIADIAHQHGFTDQAHLTHDVVTLTGTTPGFLRRISG